MVDNVVILAGGAGTRLWPASRNAFPKQFLDLGMGESLFVRTLRRAFLLNVKGEVLVVTHRDHTKLIAREVERFLGLGEFPGKRVVVLQEPLAKNTAPAITLAQRYLEIEGRKEGSVLVLPADHIITDVKSFMGDVEKASVHARNGKLVTFGIKPTRPETGYGYIEVGDGFLEDFLVKRFREKPDVDTAKKFLAMGDFYWNSGIFTFKVNKYLDELRNLSPDVYNPFARIKEIGLDMNNYYRAEGLRNGSEDVVVCEISGELERTYREVPSISIDYAVMEKTSSASMVVASFDWSDVGSWDEVARLFPAGSIASEEGKGKLVFEVEANNNYVYSDIPVAIAGIDDLIVVEKNGALLICKKGKSQLTKDVVSRIKERGKTELL